MKIIWAVILICFVQAHFLVFIIDSNAQKNSQEFSQGGTGAIDDIPKEPGWKDPTYRGWEVLSIPGLISTYYDLDLDGKLDYMVTRKISRKAAAECPSTLPPTHRL